MANNNKTLGLGLQGGGSHTAFTWGVLDRLLDEVEKRNLDIAAISGTSGGALNAAACAYGLMDGPKEAKRLLKKLWDAVSSKSLWPVDPCQMIQALLPRDSTLRWNVDYTPTAVSLGMAEQIYSPYWNPWLWDVLGEVIEEVIPDFDRLNAPNRNGPKLFVCATKVNKTALRVFRSGEQARGDVTPKALMASACYPTLFRAVEIDGEPYWDGGYMANPSLNPLVDYADDLLTVLIDPLDIAGPPPQDPRHIVSRINEVSFNASWVLEMRQIELINRLLEQNKPLYQPLHRDLAPAQSKPKEYTRKRFHLIRNDTFMEKIGASSKMNPSRDFVYELRDVGRGCADKWVSDHLEDVGRQSSLDVDEEVALRLKSSAEPVNTR
jgi:NTE family protein